MWLQKLDKTKIYRVGQQNGDLGKSCSSSTKSFCWQGSLFFQEGQSFSKAFNWLDEIHPHSGEKFTLLKVSDLNVNLT